MRDGPHNSNGDDDQRSPGPGRRGGRAARRPSGFVERATARGRSGYGSESVRPYLRDQLKLKELMGTAFRPPEPSEDPSSDET